MVKKTTLAKTAALTFGAAMTTMHAAPDLNASIVTVNFNPGSLAYSSVASTKHFDLHQWREYWHFQPME